MAEQMRVSSIVCVTASLTETGSGNNLGQKRLLDTAWYKTLLKEEPVSKVEQAGSNTSHKGVASPCPQTHMHFMWAQCSAMAAALICTDWKRAWIFQWNLVNSTDKWQNDKAYIQEKTNPFSELTLLKTDIRQPKLWEVSCCIYTSRWFFRHLWQQRKKNQNKAAKKVFWNPQCPWGIMREERTREKTEIIIP